MISYYDGQIADILPNNLMNTPEAKAFSLALREGTRLLYRYIQRVYIYCDIDNAAEEAVDLLAKELRTQYYSDSLELDTKRKLVKNSLSWYMTAGTPAAVEELIAAAFGEGKVVEWFEEGGEPYTFRIDTNAKLTDDSVSYFFDMIQRVKNTRSRLESIGVTHDIGQTIYAATADTEHGEATLTDDVVIDDTDRQVYLNAYMAITDSQETGETIWIIEADKEIETGTEIFPATGLAEMPEQILMESDKEMEAETDIYFATGFCADTCQILMEPDREIETETGLYFATGFVEMPEQILMESDRESEIESAFSAAYAVTQENEAVIGEE